MSYTYRHKETGEQLYDRRGKLYSLPGAATSGLHTYLQYKHKLPWRRRRTPEMNAELARLKQDWELVHYVTVPEAELAALRGKPAKFMSYGQTESGDEMPFLFWSFEPTKEQMHAEYRKLMPEEYPVQDDGEEWPCTNPRVIAVDVSAVL